MRHMGKNMELEVLIREFKEEDWESIKILILETQYYGPSVLQSEKKRIEFYSQVPEKGRTFVAELQSELSTVNSSTNDFMNDETSSNTITESRPIIGYCVIEFFGRAIFILSLVTAKKWQRRGIGRKLVNYAKKFGKENPQFDILRGFAEDRLAGVHTFLIKQGFKTCGYINHDLELNQSTIHYVYHFRKENENGPETLITA
jgi:ribosomal protein S18 acetylase RimI-like enzyme